MNPQAPISWLWMAVSRPALVGALLSTPFLAEHAGREVSTGRATTAQAQAVAVPYNGDFTFTRVRYGSGFGGGRGGDAWAHDWPDADRNMQMILKEFTSMHPNTQGSNIVDLESAESFLHPVLYLSEPGFWSITDVGARNLREYLLKGGFIIFDDFDANGHWESWHAQMSKALPGFQPFELTSDHAIFDTFFHIEDIYVPHPFANYRPQYFGIFEHNDPSGRMMALVNYNADLAEYWEYAVTVYFPVDPTNDAFRLGVNYFVYSLTR